MYTKILVPLEGSQNDQVVLEHVRQMAKKLGAALVLVQLHRIIKDSDPFMQRIQMEIGSAGYAKREKAEAYLAGLEQSLNAEGVEVSKAFVVTTEPEAEAIVTFAEEQQCDLIALTNQQGTGLGQWFFLNIEEKVKRRSTLPVLLVTRSREKEKR